MPHLSHPTARRLHLLDQNALLLRLAGLVALISVPFKHLPRQAREVNNIVPFNLSRLSPYTSLIIGAALLYVASQLARKKYSAFWLSVIGLVLLVIAELLRFRNPLQIALYTAALTSIIKDRRQYVIRSDLVSIRRASLTAAGILASLLLFIIAVLSVIDKRDFGADLSVSQTTNLLLHALLGLGLPHYGDVSHFGLRLVSLLHVAAISCLLIIGYSLFEPLKLRRPPSRSQRRQARQVLRSHSTSSEDYFKLWPDDKHYFFYGKSFVAYTVANGIALVLDGASGKPSDIAKLRPAFLSYTRQNGWSAAIIHANETEADSWRQLGLQSLFIGSEAVVETEEFSQTTIRNKHFRYVRNKAHKENLQFELWQPPLTSHQIGQLRAVSDAWLQHGNRREYRFVMGYFDQDYLAQCQVGILHRDGEVIAYVNQIPTYLPAVASIDHMRAKPDLPLVAMHYLLLELINCSSAHDISQFNLGLAPLSKLEVVENPNLTEKLFTIVKAFGGRYYSFAGLEQFKGKFQPDWQPRYLVYEGSPARLASVAAGLSSVTTYRTRRHWRWPKAVLPLAIVSAVAYGAFPLALLVNHAYFWRDLVSQLGASGQPYAWLFNSLDSLSAITASALFAALYCWRKPNSGLLKSALVLGIAASLGNLLSAILPLPVGFDSLHSLTVDSLLQHPIVILHGIASFINSAAFVLSLLLLGYYFWTYHRSAWRLQYAFLVFAIATFGALIGAVWPASAPSLQRLFIIGYGIWTVLLARDILEATKN